MMPAARVVSLDGRAHVGAALRSLHGDSRGWWDGDTMVVETTNFTDRTAFRGSSEHLKVTERLTLVDANTIRYQFTVEDPHTWDRPWSGEYPITRINEAIYEYACHEGNYGMPNILKAQRAVEAQERAKELGVADSRLAASRATGRRMPLGGEPSFLQRPHLSLGQCGRVRVSPRQRRPHPARFS